MIQLLDNGDKNLLQAHPHLPDTHTQQLSVCVDLLSSTYASINLAKKKIVPNGQDVLVYGGSKDGNNGTSLVTITYSFSKKSKIALADYSYIFNIPTMTWKQFNLVAPSGAFGPRTGHSGKFDTMF